MTLDIRSLEQTLLENLPWNKARIKFVTRFLLALFAVRTVNLSKLATAFSGRAKEESNYKRLQRFLHNFELPYAELANFVVKLLGIPGPYRLALDRTNWKVGTVDINILMLSIVYRGIGFPVVWLALPKTGNSDTIERQTVIEIFIDLFGAQNIQCLLGDREFIGKQWFRFLRQHRIKFQMRLKKDTLVPQQPWEARSGLAIVCLNQSQPDVSHSRCTPDVGNGIVLERLLSGRGRISDSGFAGLLACAAQGVQKTLGH